jgi:hypothetical protein
MSILDFTSTTQAPVRNSRQPFNGLTQPDGTPKPRAKLWLNIGREVNGRFISLPLGQAIDTMEAGAVRGQNEEYVKQRTAENDLLKALQALGFTFQPGEERKVNLEVRLRRVNDEIVVDQATNEYAIDATTLLAGE